MDLCPHLSSSTSKDDIELYANNIINQAIEDVNDGNKKKWIDQVVKDEIRKKVPEIKMEMKGESGIKAVKVSGIINTTPKVINHY